MSSETCTAVTYEGLHGVRGTKRSAFEAIQSFLSECGVADGAPSFSLTNPTGHGRAVIDEVWADDIVDVLDGTHPSPQDHAASAGMRLDVRAIFLLLDPVSLQPIGGQTDDLFYRLGYRNQLQLFLDQHTALKIELCIPAPEEELLSRVLPWLQAHLPIRLSTKHWREWRPTKSGTLTRRKLDVSHLL